MKQFFYKYFAAVSAILFAVLILFDQWTKALAVSHLKEQAPFVIWDGVLEFHYFENTGAAWGMLKEQQILFYILTVLFAVAVFYEIYRLRKEVRFMPFMYTLVLMFAGAMGNFIDRLTNRYVIDFVYVKLIHFPIFNVADCYITISVILMVLLMFFYYTDNEFDRILPAVFSKKKKEQV